MVGHSHDVGTRIQALALVEYGVSTKLAAELTGLSIRSINRLKKTAQERGYDPQKSKVLLTKYVADAPRSGRPKIFASEKEKAVLDGVKKDRCDRCSGSSRGGGEDSRDDVSETAAAGPATQWSRDSGGGDSRGSGGSGDGGGDSGDDASEAAAAGPVTQRSRDSGGGDSRGSGGGDSRDGGGSGDGGRDSRDDASETAETMPVRQQWRGQ